MKSAINIKFRSERSIARVILLALTAVSFLIPAQVRAQVNAEQVMTIGRNVLSMEDYLLAIQYFNMALKAKPYLAEAYYLRGLAKLQLDDYEGAEADCSLALDRNKFKTEAYKVRGFARQHLGKDSLAIADYEKGLEYDPEDKYFLFYKGVAESSLKQYNRADSTFTRVLRRNPKFEDAYIARGQMNMMRGDTVAAMKDLDRALEISFNNVDVFLMKAQMLAERKQWRDAAQALDEAVRLRPEEVDLYINRAYVRYNLDDFFGAMADYNYALTLEPHNETALFNRALLSTEVKALTQAVKDFSEVLRIDPANFHAIYNRGLIYLEMGQYRKAYDDFKEIARRYPRFHPAYYAMAQCQQHLGNIADMVANIKKGDALVSAYVANPSRNPLDRPTIQPGKTNTKRAGTKDLSEEEEVMEKFNQLVTTSPSTEPQFAFNEKIKGRVQDRNIAVLPESPYSLSFFAPESGLRNMTEGFRNLDDLNRREYISRKIFMHSGSPTPSDNDLLSKIFAIEEDFSTAISATDSPRPIDFFARGVSRLMLKNYDGAIADLTRAAEGADDFTSALFARSFAYMEKSALCASDEEKSLGANTVPGVSQSAYYLQAAMGDLDALLDIDPSMFYAWFNKGCIFYQAGDLTSAISAYTKALELNPEFGEAYFNRGLSYMRQGNREKAFADLSKAGEKGIIQSYNILKRMK